MAETANLNSEFVTVIIERLKYMIKNTSLLPKSHEKPRLSKIISPRICEIFWLLERILLFIYWGFRASFALKAMIITIKFQ